MHRSLLALVVPVLLCSACKPVDCRDVDPWYDYPGQTFTFELRDLADHPAFNRIPLPLCEPLLDFQASFSVTQTDELDRPGGHGCPVLTGDSDLFVVDTVWSIPPEYPSGVSSILDAIMYSAFYLGGDTTRADGCSGYYSLIISAEPTSETEDQIFFDPPIGTQAYWYAHVIFEPVMSCAAPTAQIESCVEFYPMVLTSISS